jgi:hypothetical protein
VRSSVSQQSKVLRGRNGKEGVIIRTESKGIGVEGESKEGVWHHR